MNFKSIILIIPLFLSSYSIFAQTQEGKVIDNISAIVGSNIILKSEIETQYIQAMAQGNKGGDLLRCKIFEELLFQKLLLHQAEIDSVVVTESQIESDMDRRLRYFINQIGSQEKLEEYYKKSISEIKDEFRSFIKDQLLAQQVQAKITDKIKITPTEVSTFYKSIPKDSLTLINSEIEIGHIVKSPRISDIIKQETRNKLIELRERVIKENDFAALAVLYSEDPGSAKKGGELGFTNRGELYPEFEAVAYNLKVGEVSQVLESKAGFHIIQLIERRGERINVRHILIQPKPSVADIARAKNELDSVYTLIQAGKYTFVEAAQKFSDDLSKNNSGIIMNPATGTTKFDAKDIDPSLFFIVDNLKAGEISKPVPMKTDDGKQAYRIVYLKSRTVPHTANLKDDYDKIQTLALQFKQNQEVDKWVNNRLKSTYINILDKSLNCTFKNKWIQ